MNLNVDPKDLFGSDLSAIFGPKANRVHISKLSRKEIEDRINLLPEYVSTDTLGEFPTLLEVTNFILYVVKRSRAMDGIDLDWCDSLKLHGLVRPEEMYKPVGLFSKNNPIQRGVQVRHLFRDLLFPFNPAWVQSALTRFSPLQGRYYLNDAQHRYIACVIMGIREIPTEYIVSELISVDVEQYSCVNLASLVASEFDKFRVKVQAVTLANREGVILKNPSFYAAYEVFKILEANGCRLIEQGSKDNANALECTSTGNMLRHYQDYGNEIFARAVAINAEVFTKTSIGTPNIWGICAFLKKQADEGVLNCDEFAIDMAVTDALLYRYPDRNRKSFYQEAKKAVDIGTREELAIPYQDKVAAGIEKIIRVVSPNVKWAEIKFAGKNIADTYMESYSVVPLQKKLKVA